MRRHNSGSDCRDAQCAFGTLGSSVPRFLGSSGYPVELGHRGTEVPRYRGTVAFRNVRRALRVPTVALAACTFAFAIFAQSTPPPLATDEKLPSHDISMTDTPEPGSAIAVPLPESQRKRLRKYDIPELVGAHQALGSQTINGHLPKPIVDYTVHTGPVTQRLSLFEGGLVFMKMAGAGGTIQKKLLLPPDAHAVYVKNLSAAALEERSTRAMIADPQPGSRASIRVYDQRSGRASELAFDPRVALPKQISDQILPLEDLMRAMSVDREVTNSIARYQPQVGDHLVGDDRKTWEVIRVLADGRIVELRCDNQPVTIFVAKDTLYNYFIGSRRAPAR
jgi:hypothetical protein